MKASTCDPAKIEAWPVTATDASDTGVEPKSMTAVPCPGISYVILITPLVVSGVKVNVSPFVPFNAIDEPLSQ